MKKIFLLGTAVLALSVLTSCKKDEDVLYLLNWGEYIDTDLIEKFESEYKCTIEMSEVTSSEAMYNKISEGIRYDVAIPGDYIIEKMVNEDMAKQLDKSKIENFSSSNIFNDKLTTIISNTYSGTEYNPLDYAAPYFWGSYAIIYNTKKDYIKDVVEANGFNALFDRSLYGSNANNVNLAMYDVPRWGLTAWLIKEGKDINTNNVDDFNNASNDFKNADYKVWGDDNIKKQIQAGNLDVGLVQLGDFFDEYYVVGETNDEFNVGCFIPAENAAFFDGMMIPSTCENEDLAYKFINFMLDVENAFTNAQYVGYCPTLKGVCDAFRNDSEYEEQLNDYPFYLDPFYNVLNVSGIKQFRNIDTMSNGVDYQTYLSNLYSTAKVK